jgi:hypothetical protein
MCVSGLKASKVRCSEAKVLTVDPLLSKLIVSHTLKLKPLRLYSKQSAEIYRPDRLEVAVTCQVAGDCQNTVQDLNPRMDAKFPNWIHFGYSALNSIPPAAGWNRLDRAELNRLDQVGAGEFVAHELIEALK